MSFGNRMKTIEVLAKLNYLTSVIQKYPFKDDALEHLAKESSVLRRKLAEIRTNTYDHKEMEFLLKAEEALKQNDKAQNQMENNKNE